MGDLCFLGFSFDSEGIVSPSKFIGALGPLLAHTIILAYGDDQAQKIKAETGLITQFIMNLRCVAQRVTTSFPTIFKNTIKENPVGIPFLILSLNGFGLLGDVLVRVKDGLKVEGLIQGLLGIFIITGTLSFARADFTASQGGSDGYLKAGRVFFTLASLANIGLALLSLNVFLLLSVVLFVISNLATYFVRINKHEAPKGTPT